jgi:hypothetical protein
MGGHCLRLFWVGESTNPHRIWFRLIIYFLFLLFVRLYISPTQLKLYSSFTGSWRPDLPIRTLFQARAGTRVEPSTFCVLAGNLSLMKESKVFGRFRTYSSEGQLNINVQEGDLIIMCCLSVFKFQIYNSIFIE